MIAELALAALLDSTAIQAPAPKETVYVMQVQPGAMVPDAKIQKESSKAAGIIVGLAAMIGGTAILIHGLDSRGYHVDISNSGEVALKRNAVNVEMIAGFGVFIAGAVVISL